MHKGKKEAYSADMKRKEGIRDAVAPAAAAYEEAKKALKQASIARHAAVKEAQDPPASVRQLAFAACHCSIFAGSTSPLGMSTSMRCTRHGIQDLGGTLH